MDVTTIEVSPLEPTDEPTLAAVERLARAAYATDAPDLPPPCPVEFRARLHRRLSYERTERYVARCGGQVTGYLQLNLPQRTNRENAEVALLVDPASPWSASAGPAAPPARPDLSLGRRRLMGVAAAGLAGDAVGGRAGGVFAAAMGARAVLEEVQRRLDLSTVDGAELDVLADGARARATAYRVVQWRGGFLSGGPPTPRTCVAGWQDPTRRSGIPPANRPRWTYP